MIDCRKSELNFIKNNIIHSKLNEIFNLDNIDWIKIGQDSEKSLVKEVCEYWNTHNDINNENLTTKDLAKTFKKDKSTIRDYLRKGNNLGWCNYNSKEELRKNAYRNGIKNTKKIEIFKEGTSLGKFESSKKLSEMSYELFGVFLNYNSINRVCNGSRKSYKGFVFKRLY